jgi:signal recognition particle receptor subunit beta
MGGRGVEGTPIFDELRDLFDRSPGRFPTPARSGVDPRIEAGNVDRPPAKIVIAGGRGVGKTTFVGSVSDTDPVTVEAVTDVGRITLHRDLVLYLLGTSEPSRAAFAGALGAVVLVDPRRIEDAFATITYFERSAVPFVAAVNMFDGEVVHELDELREALALGPDVPLTTCDARDPESAAQTLRELVSYTMNVGGSDQTSPPEIPA